MNTYPEHLKHNLKDKMRNMFKSPKRKRKVVELRPSNLNSMKKQPPYFGYHKNYIHPWSLFQKACALQYRKLSNSQKNQLQFNSPKIEYFFNNHFQHSPKSSQFQQPLFIKNTHSQQTPSNNSRTNSS